MIRPGQVILANAYKIYILRLSYSGNMALYYFIGSEKRTEYSVDTYKLEEWIEQGDYILWSHPVLTAIPSFSTIHCYYDDERKGESFRIGGGEYWVNTDGENWWIHSSNYDDDNPYLVMSGQEELKKLHAQYLAVGSY
jgi:hypothetical protein